MRLCPHSRALEEHWKLLVLGYLPQPGTVIEAALVLQAVVPSENFHIH